jgi:hypothetical protein
MRLRPVRTLLGLQATPPQPRRNPIQPSSLFPHEFKPGDKLMLKGGLLWLIGIPLPIILILFFMGWLS